MGESRTARAPSSKRSSEQMFRPNKFGTVVLALWPDKPALNLAQRVGCTERAANLYINGRRKYSARALRAIINELE